MGKKAARICWIGTALLTLWVTGCVRSGTEPPPTRQTTEATRQTTETTQSTGPVTCAYVEQTDQIPVLDRPEEDSCTGTFRENDLFTVSQVRFSKRVSNVQVGNIAQICADPLELRRGSRYHAWYMEKGKAQRLENTSVTKDYRILGTTMHLELNYAVYGEGQSVLTYVPESWEETEGFRFWDTGRTRQWLLTYPLRLDSERVMAYPVRLDLTTGQLTDFLKGIDKQALYPALEGCPREVQTVRDESLLIESGQGAWFYVDVPQGQVWDLNAMTGSEPEGCAVLPDGILCCGRQGDFRLVEWETGGVRPLLTGIEPFYTSLGQSFVLYTGEDGTVHAYDFVSRQDIALTELGDWTLENSSGWPSPDGRKWMTIRMGENGVYQIGVFDCDRQRFLSIHRTGSLGAEEELVQWDNLSQIVVSGPESMELYVYSLK